MQKKEWELLGETLPLMDFLTVFTLGACRAVVEALPHYGGKVLVLRHGVHIYPRVSQDEARQKLIDYLIHQARIPPREKAGLRRIEKYFTSRDTVLLGNYGFIMPDKGPPQLYELGRHVQERPPNHRIMTLFV
ncbi:MAG: hypothetical protein JSW70_02155 [Syntrophobacterales bacterium]|nr:MAG: hypothetical protein JSW70_02155 [Syntrophobacterales bacterium]